MRWFHGTPDAREVKAREGFEARFEKRRLIRDPERLPEARQQAAELGLSREEEARRMSALAACFENVDVRVPVFASARRDTAASYADDRRAFDYQNAEPAVFEIDVDLPVDLVIDAEGGTFRDVKWENVQRALLAIGHDPEDVRSVLTGKMGKSVEDRLRVSDLGTLLWMSGFETIEVRNVIDTHTGKGRPDTVLMCFRPEELRIPELDTSPSL